MQKLCQLIFFYFSLLLSFPSCIRFAMYEKHKSIQKILLNILSLMYEKILNIISPMYKKFSTLFLLCIKITFINFQHNFHFYILTYLMPFCKSYKISLFPCNFYFKPILKPYYFQILLIKTCI